MFFKIQKKHDFLRFLSRCTRFLEQRFENVIIDSSIGKKEFRCDFEICYDDKE